MKGNVRFIVALSHRLAELLLPDIIDSNSEDIDPTLCKSRSTAREVVRMFLHGMKLP